MLKTNFHHLLLHGDPSLDIDFVRLFQYHLRCSTDITVVILQSSDDSDLVLPIAIGSHLHLKVRQIIH